MSKDEIAVYLGTLNAIIDVMNRTPGITIKKLRKFLEDELKEIKDNLGIREH